LIRSIVPQCLVLLIGLLFAAGCSSSVPDGPVRPTIPADPDPPVSIRPTTIPPTSAAAEPSVTDPPPTTQPREPSDPLEASMTCAELFAAATPVLRTALTVLDDALGGRSEREILDLPVTEIDEVFDSMTEVPGYDTFSDRRQALACTSTAGTAGCDDRLEDVAATTLDPLLTDQWLTSLGCDAAEADDR
jgi:hypothetical protein